MEYIYTPEEHSKKDRTQKENEKNNLFLVPQKQTINNILAYSKALEVIPSRFIGEIETLKN